MSSAVPSRHAAGPFRSRSKRDAVSAPSTSRSGIQSKARTGQVARLIANVLFQMVGVLFYTVLSLAFAIAAMAVFIVALAWTLLLPALIAGAVLAIVGLVLGGPGFG